MNERLVIRGNYYYARFYVNGKPKMLSTKVPVKGNNKRKAESYIFPLVLLYPFVFYTPLYACIFCSVCISL